MTLGISGRGLSEGPYKIQLRTNRFQEFDTSGVSMTAGALVFYDSNGTAAQIWAFVNILMAHISRADWCSAERMCSLFVDSLWRRLENDRDPYFGVHVAFID